jgi:sucrose-6F-phosphate phosphohydrolase
MTWLFVSDVDDTLLGGPEAELIALMDALAARPPGCIVAYNSSRPCASLRQSLARQPHLRPPDYLIGALGAEMEQGSSGEPLADYQAIFQANGRWSRPTIEQIISRWQLTPHAAEYQTPFKVSYDLPDAAWLPAIQAALQAAALDAQIIHSGGRNLDIIPQAAGKQAAVNYLRQLHRIPPAQVAVAGDSGNDRDMFVPPYKGIVVANADADLRQLTGDHIYHAQSPQAAGVLEGLRHWGFLGRSTDFADYAD